MKVEVLSLFSHPFYVFDYFLFKSIVQKSIEGNLCFKIFGQFWLLFGPIIDYLWSIMPLMRHGSLMIYKFWNFSNKFWDSELFFSSRIWNLSAEYDVNHLTNYQKLHMTHNIFLERIYTPFTLGLPHPGIHWNSCG